MLGGDGGGLVDGPKSSGEWREMGKKAETMNWGNILSLGSGDLSYILVRNSLC